MKKVLLSFGAVAIAVAVAPMFAAFEAHVVNVTAKIENALQVPIKFLDFGTVFPQEHLEQQMSVSLSQSFLDEGRVDDVQYFIRQKPKCAITTDNGQSYDATVGQDGTHLYTGTGHLVLNQETGEVTIECGEAPRELTEGEIWGVLPSLCEYISKDGDSEFDRDGEDVDGNDSTTPSFHQPYEVVLNDNGTPQDPTDDFYEIVYLDTTGYLSKIVQDTDDNWVIDLAVPCFGGYCAQDWAAFVNSINPDADPDQYTQDISNEHKVFGCDLWFEVSGVSLTPPPPDGV